ncbi:MAG: PKD domain-containing protein [Candidatus Omnitrophica bacterium]|nr:PKD domain-containing protein [Candidatus Omnitrophota bacterium]
MRRILVLLFFAFVLSGCATYKFQKSGPSASQGYVATYDGKPVLEYTVGQGKSLPPDLTLARERFKRRRAKVEYYYKNMGQIRSRMMEFFWDPPAMLVDFMWGVVRWPFIAYSDYKYNRDPKYREKVDKLDEQKDALEKARVNSLREKLNAYINEDIAKESLKQGQALSLAPAAAPKIEPPAEAQLPAPPAEPQPTVPEPQPALVQSQPTEVKPVSVEVKPVVKPSPEPPVAVIIARPAKGFSPLKVNFSGQKSYSKSGRIVSYDWDFGDGDTSAKKNPENTYWSTTYGTRSFTATLTVRDEAGNSSSASTVIEVSTH